MLTDKAVKILTEERKLDPELLSKLGIESITSKSGVEWIRIPYFSGSELVNNKYRSIEGKKDFRQDPDARQCFWNINALTDVSLKNHPIVITEGELDCMVALQAGFSRSVSVPGGAPAKELGDGEGTKYRFLDDAMKLFAGETQIIIASDNDNNGINLLHDLSLRLGKTRCKWIKYPEGCKDLNDVLRLHGIEKVNECLWQADWVKSDGVYKLSELPPIVEQPILHMGFPPLDNHYKIRKGDFAVLTGIPNHGKSSFLNDVACRMAWNHNWRIGFASFEQVAQTTHRRNLASWYLRNHADQASDADNQKANQWIDKHFRFIVVGDDDFPNLEWMIEKMQIAVIQQECDMIIIDPWNEMDHTRPDKLTLTEYTGFAIKQFKRLARMLNIHLIVAAHPPKLKKEDGKYAPPNLYDISDSAHWANKADVGLTVFRPDLTENVTHLIVNKIRNQPEMGVPGLVKAHFVTNMKRYEEMPPEADEDL